MGNLTATLGIKCVQPVQGLRMKVCTTVASTQPGPGLLSVLCTKSIPSPILQQFVHSHLSRRSIRYRTTLYTVSTEPTITTILMNNKRQEQPKKEIS